MRLAAILQSTPAHMASGFLCMGAWALWVNFPHGLPAALMAGAVQGSLSATITLIMKKALEAVSAAFALRGAAMFALIAPPFLVCSVSLIALITGHSLAKTPELWATIAVPFAVAFGYACLYSFGLHKIRQAQ